MAFSLSFIPKEKQKTCTNSIYFASFLFCLFYFSWTIPSSYITTESYSGKTFLSSSCYKRLLRGAYLARGDSYTVVLRCFFERRSSQSRKTYRKQLIRFVFRFFVPFFILLYCIYSSRVRDIFFLIIFSYKNVQGKVFCC